MIHYHGTPIGGRRQDVISLLTGRHALVPFASPEDLPAVAEVCQSFVLDNSAYKYWRTGEKMNGPAFFEWVEKWHRHPGFDWAIIPDVIEGTAEENDRFLDMWPSNLKGIPVYHNYFPISRIKKMADKYEMIALGSSGPYSKVGSKKWWNRMAEIMNAITDSSGRPVIKLHGLRMMDPNLFSRLPLASADSTNVAQNKSIVGPYDSPTVLQNARKIADRVEAHNSAGFWTVQATQSELLFF